MNIYVANPSYALEIDLIEIEGIHITYKGFLSNE